MDTTKHDEDELARLTRKLAEDKAELERISRDDTFVEDELLMQEVSAVHQKFAELKRRTVEKSDADLEARSAALQERAGRVWESLDSLGTVAAKAASRLAAIEGRDGDGDAMDEILARFEGASPVRHDPDELRELAHKALDRSIRAGINRRLGRDGYYDQGKMLERLLQMTTETIAHLRMSHDELQSALRSLRSTVGKELEEEFDRLNDRESAETSRVIKGSEGRQDALKAFARTALEQSIAQTEARIAQLKA